MNKRFAALFTTNFLGTLNDNYQKMLALLFVTQWIADVGMQSIYIAIAGAAIVVPYIFCSPIANRLAEKYGKRNVVIVAKWCEVPIVSIASIGFYIHNLPLIITALLLMGLQSSLYSPAKYGLIREIGGVENVSNGMGGMEAASFGGMLLGTVLASLMIGTFGMNELQCSSVLIILACLGITSAYLIKVPQQVTESNYASDSSGDISKVQKLVSALNPFVYAKEAHDIARRHRGLNSIIYVLSVFWWFAATMQMGLLVFCKDEMNLDDTVAGLMVALTAIGVSIGCVIAGAIGKKKFELGRVPLYGVLMSAILVVMFAVVPMQTWLYAILLLALSIIGGFFKVPLDAEIQRIVKNEELNVILAYFNQISFFAIFIASITYSVISNIYPQHAMFLMLAIGLFAASIYAIFTYRPLIAYTVRNLLHLRYKVKIVGKEHLYNQRTHLILPNHQAIIDPIIIFAEFYDHKMYPLVDGRFWKSGMIVRHILGLMNAVEVPDLALTHNSQDVNQVKSLNNIVLSNLQEHNDIIFYPSGHITTDGKETIGNRRLAYEVCQQLPEKVEVLGVKIDGLWGSVWSRKGRRTSPPLGQTLLRAIGLLFIIRPRRKVLVHIQPITTKVCLWATTLEKKQFNEQLEQFYND